MLKDVMIGRTAELARLDQCMKEERPQLIIVYGRRRVGKTYLINQYFEGRFDFKITGIYQAKKDVQLNNFAAELSRQMKCAHPAPHDWFSAFNLLRDYLVLLPQDEKHVVFF